MPTPSEEQDKEMTMQGFHLDKDYECPALTEEEYNSLKLLREKSRDEKAREKFFNAFSDFFNKLSKASSMFETLEYRALIYFITHDGGEIREMTAYEADGITQKQGWRRLYWK